MSDTIVYSIDGNVYINLTNRCSNSCEFCVRNGKDSYYGNRLWLTREPTAAEVIAELEAFETGKEYVFCGFGEPLFALDVLLETARYLKGKGKKTRLNTNGQADLICGEGVAARLKGLIDTVSISLNAATGEKYQSLCRCEYGEEGFASLLRFAVDCREQGLDVRLSIVDCVGEEEISAAQRLADGIGVKLRVRTLIVNS